MNFRRGFPRDEPEINFIPLIDLLLVILIFLMVTTTYSRLSELQITLPAASADRAAQHPKEIVVTVGQDGRYLIDQQRVNFTTSAAFAEELARAAHGDPRMAVVIHADAGSTHQAVVNVLEAARLAGLARVSFAAQGPVPAARGR